MRKLLLIAFLVFLPACSVIGPLQPAPVGASASLPEAGRVAQAAVNEANIALTAAAHVIAANVKDGIWTKPQAQSYLDKVKEYAKRVDQAQDLVRLGSFASAQAQADTVRALIVVLHREVAAQARKEAK